MEKPKAPVVFNKQITCVVGPGAGIEVPTVAPKWVDYEGELGVVIGTRCRNVSVADAPSRWSPVTSSSTTCPFAIGSERRRR